MNQPATLPAFSMPTVTHPVYVPARILATTYRYTPRVRS